MKLISLVRLGRWKLVLARRLPHRAGHRVVALLALPLLAGVVDLLAEPLGALLHLVGVAFVLAHQGGGYPSSSERARSSSFSRRYACFSARRTWVCSSVGSSAWSARSRSADSRWIFSIR